MPVPEFYYFIRPVLQFHADGQEHSMHETREFVADALQLTKEDREELVASGNSTKLYDRCQWALTYLRAARLLEQPRRAWNKITDRGLEYLKRAPDVIRPKDLHEFEEFIAFDSGSTRKRTVPTPPEALDTDSASPEEVMDAAYARLRSKLVDDVLDRVKSMPPALFENLIVQLMLRLGYGGADPDAGEVVGRPGDGGVDGVISEDKLGLDKIYLQAKRYTTGVVGSPEVQAFAGALVFRGAKKGVMITTATFSQSAIAYASGLGDYKISLVDGRALAGLMIDNDLGVSLSRRFDLKRVDSDFFGAE